MGYTTSGIRNIALIGQAGAGKTSLLETVLLQANAIRTRGSLARGTTVSDFDPQEKRLQHSLDTTIAGFEHQGVRVNVIDTPGYADFLGKTLAVLEAVEAVAIVVSAVGGVDALTLRLLEFARERELCRLIVINKIDAREARCAEVLAQLRELIGPEVLPLNLPAGGGDAVVDCFFQPRGRATDFSSVAAAHTQIIDQVVELDEVLMALYLEQGEELSPEQLHDPFEQALREGHRDERKCREEAMAKLLQGAPAQNANQSYIEEGIQLLDLARRAHVLFENQRPAEKRKLLDFVLSNCRWKAGHLEAEYRKPFDMLAVVVAAQNSAEGRIGGEAGQNENWLRKQDSNRCTLG